MDNKRKITEQIVIFLWLRKMCKKDGDSLCFLLAALTSFWQKGRGDTQGWEAKKRGRYNPACCFSVFLQSFGTIRMS